MPLFYGASFLRDYRPSSMVQIHENYRDYVPPGNPRSQVGVALRYVPEKRLAGLGSILLTNTAALSRAERRAKTWSRGKKVRSAKSLASYRRAWNNNPAAIRVLLDNVFAGWPWWLVMIPPLRTAGLARVLYHEIGHHIHATSRPEHREPEDVADLWSTRLMRRLARRRYWYVALPMSIILPPALWLYRRVQRAGRRPNRP
jgi:hypothetical protein